MAKRGSELNVTTGGALQGLCTQIPLSVPALEIRVFLPPRNREGISHVRVYALLQKKVWLPLLHKYLCLEIFNLPKCHCLRWHVLNPSEGFSPLICRSITWEPVKMQAPTP